MTADTRKALVAQLIHLGCMPGDAEILASHADNTLPSGATFAEAYDYIKTHFEI